MAHTPGPWTAALNGNGFNGSVYVMAGDVELCEVFDDSESAALPDAENARLIAAAPDLLEALQNAAGFMDTPISRRRNAGDSFYEETVRTIRAAIAKAEGRS